MILFSSFTANVWHHKQEKRYSEQRKINKLKNMTQNEHKDIYAAPG